LISNNIGNLGIEHLKKACFKFLQRVTLTNAYIGFIGIKSLSECDWHYLKWLNLSNNKIGNKGLKIIIEKGNWPWLHSFSVEKAGLTRDGLNLLLKNSWNKIEFIRLG